MEYEMLTNKSYIKNWFIKIFTILTKNTAKNILFASFTFSFLDWSLYIGSFIKKLVKNISNVIINISVPEKPVTIPFAINAIKVIAMIGISFAIAAPIIAIPNGEHPYPIVT